MPTYIQYLLTAAFTGIMAHGLVQAAPAFEYRKTLIFNVKTDKGTANRRMTSAASGPDGKVYFVSNFSDRIHVFDPMTFNGTDAELEVIGTGTGFENSSFTGITVDKETGDVYAAGPALMQTATPNNSIIRRYTKSGSKWNETVLDRMDGNALGGVQSIDANRLVFSNARTGNLYFFEFDPVTHTLVPKSAAKGDNNGLWSPSLAADTVHKKIYQGRAKNTAPAVAAAVDVFSYAFNPQANQISAERIGNAVSGTPSKADTPQPLQYQSVAVNEAGTLLAVSVNVASQAATDTTVNYFDIYDVSGETPVKIKTLNGSEAPNSPAHRAGTRGYAATFFKQDGKEYLLTFYSNVNSTQIPPYPASMSRGHIYEVVANGTPASE